MSPCTALNPTRSHVRVKQCPCGRPATSMLKSVPCCDTCAAREYESDKAQAARERRERNRLLLLRERGMSSFDRALTQYMRLRGIAYHFDREFSPRKPQADPHTDLNIHPGSRTIPTAAA